MSLKQIKDILDSRQIAATDAEIKAVIKEKGFTLTALSEENTIQVIEAVAKSKSAITQKTVTKLQTQANEAKKRANGNRYKEEIEKDVAAILEPLDSYTGKLEAYAQKIEDDAVGKACERLNDVPINILRRIAESSQLYQSNPDFFRKTADEVYSALFADFTAE